VVVRSSWLVVVLLLLASGGGRAQSQPPPQQSATGRAAEFDLGGAVLLLITPASQGEVGARIALAYLRGLIAAREAFREGGAADALAPVRKSIAELGALAKGQPGEAEIARLVLQAAAAAAQSERDEMRLYLDSATQMESLQDAVGQPGAPLVAAAEVAGDLWLQVHRYDEARAAYAAAAERIGFTPRILYGLARTARRSNDMAAACTEYRRLTDAWGGRPDRPAEIVEASEYLDGCTR
jgi:hypothetical protein